MMELCVEEKCSGRGAGGRGPANGQLRAAGEGEDEDKDKDKDTSRERKRPQRTPPRSKRWLAFALRLDRASASPSRSHTVLRVLQKSVQSADQSKVWLLEVCLRSYMVSVYALSELPRPKPRRAGAYTGRCAIPLLEKVEVSIADNCPQTVDHRETSPIDSGITNGDEKIYFNNGVKLGRYKLR